LIQKWKNNNKPLRFLIQIYICGMLTLPDNLYGKLMSRNFFDPLFMRYSFDYLSHELFVSGILSRVCDHCLFAFNLSVTSFWNQGGFQNEETSRARFDAVYPFPFEIVVMVGRDRIHRLAHGRPVDRRGRASDGIGPEFTGMAAPAADVAPVSLIWELRCRAQFLGVEITLMRFAPLVEGDSKVGEFSLLSHFLRELASHIISICKDIPAKFLRKIVAAVRQFSELFRTNEKEKMLIFKGSNSHLPRFPTDWQRR
jgi:hypothetical protein